MYCALVLAAAAATISMRAIVGNSNIAHAATTKDQRLATSRADAVIVRFHGGDTPILDYRT
jgi:hypothetical protein